MYDVLIIGGGVTGSAIARELSRYDLKTALFEKGEDVCSGTSKANSGIAHAGFDPAASGSPFPGWNQAADQGGYGTLSGRILLYEGHGHSGKGAGDSSGGSHESRRRVQDADRR